MASHPGGVEILLVASCHGNQDKLRPDGPPGSYVETLSFFIALGYSINQAFKWENGPAKGRVAKVSPSFL